MSKPNGIIRDDWSRVSFYVVLAITVLLAVYLLISEQSPLNLSAGFALGYLALYYRERGKRVTVIMNVQHPAVGGSADEFERQFAERLRQMRR